MNLTKLENILYESSNYLKNLNYLEIRWYQSIPHLKCYCIPKNKRICLLSYQDSVLCQNIKVSCSQDEINLGNKTCTINCRIRLDSYQMSKHSYHIKKSFVPLDRLQIA